MRFGAAGLLFSLMLMLCSITSFAATTDPFKDADAQIKTRLQTIVEELRDGNNSDSADKLEAVIESLDELDDNEEDLKSAEAAINMISAVMKSTKVSETTGWTNVGNSSRTMMQVSWINQFGECAAPYGFNTHKYEYTTDIYTGEDIAGDTGEVLDSAANDALNSSDMVQKLRWTKKDDQSKVNIVSVIERYETQFSSVSALLQSISAALLIAFGCSNLLKMTQDRMISQDAITREFVKIIFGLWFIFNYKYFTILALRIGTYFTEVFLDITNQQQAISDYSVSTLRHCIWQSLDNMMSNGKAENWFKGLANTATGAYEVIASEKDPWYTQIGTAICSAFGGISGAALGGTLVNLSINWVVFAVLIELGIRYIFTPIAIADLYSEGFHSNGMRWIKKMIACALTGGLVYLVMFGANVLKTQLTGFHPMQLTAINLTMCGAFVKMRQIADEIVGVR